MIETPASQNSFSTSAASKLPGRVEHVAATVACDPVSGISPSNEF
jgi:hypothetical protein